eukprot:999671_1
MGHPQQVCSPPATQKLLVQCIFVMTEWRFILFRMLCADIATASWTTRKIHQIQRHLSWPHHKTDDDQSMIQTMVFLTFIIGQTLKNRSSIDERMKTSIIISMVEKRSQKTCTRKVYFL